MFELYIGDLYIKNEVIPVRRRMVMVLIWRRIEMVSGIFGPPRRYTTDTTG